MRNVFTVVCSVVVCLLLGSTVNAEEYRLLQFRAKWCGPCQLQKKIFNDHGIATILKNYNVRDHQLDIDESPGKEAAKAWGVRSIPTTILVLITGKDEARPIKRWGDGPMTGEQFKEFVNPRAPLPAQE